jgi:hypothetical protein
MSSGSEETQIYPPHIQRLVDEWIATQIIPPEPRLVLLKDGSEFDFIAHQNDVVEFEWFKDGDAGFQYLHNTNVLATYARKKNPKPSVASEYYVLLSAEELAQCAAIQVYIGGNLLNNMYIEFVQMWNSMLDIMPPAPQPPPGSHLLFTGGYGSDDYIEMPVCRLVLKFRDGSPLKDLPLHKARYPS